MKNEKVKQVSSRSFERRLSGPRPRERADEDRHDAELIAMAVEPVPLGTGLEELGRGGHCYVKMNLMDGSIRCFRFRTRAAADLAARAGVAAEMSEAS